MICPPPTTFDRDDCRPERPGFVATTTRGLFDSRGEPLLIKRGITRVHHDNELARMYPDCFEVEGDGPDPRARQTGRKRTRTGASRTPPSATLPRRQAKVEDELPRPSWALDCGPLNVEASPASLLSTMSPTKVRIPRDTRDQIAEAMARIPEGYETGGMLIREHSFSSDIVLLRQALGPGPSAHLQRDALRLDWPQEHYVARTICDESERRLVLAGMWHVHPSGPLRPSDADLDIFSRLMTHADEHVWPMATYTAIIAGPGARSWDPELTAWVCRRRSVGPVACERAEVIA